VLSWPERLWHNSRLTSRVSDFVKTDLGNLNEYIALPSSGVMIKITFVIIGHLFRNLKMTSHNALSYHNLFFLFIYF